ncbi:Signal transduction histidine kinase [Amycolatopsis marina]|uniref:histidine kinase n=1 Tax=Amycolatopsis marina TaxID=490629 RepID=A0A1I0W624_9PSEU|nr:nitrate- and nitrite sensing domain-containing protein [Amycolatopsis marina]SFA83994.1 Signal transduction histidine kinase [Amycolatopsis marina]
MPGNLGGRTKENEPQEDADHVADNESAEQAPGTADSSRWRLRNWRLRSKLAAVLIIPTLTALALGGLRALDETNRANELHQTVDRIDLVASLTTAVHELQGERTLMVASIASGGRRDSSDLDEQIAKVDGAVADLSVAVDHLSEGDQAFRQRYFNGLQRLDALEPLRNAASSTNFSDLSTLGSYTSILDSLVQLGREVNTGIADRGLLRLGSTTQSLSEGKELLARENAALQIAAWRNGFPADLLYQARAAEAGSSGAINSFTASATPEQQRLYSDTVSGPEVDNLERVGTVAFARADEGQPLDIPIPGLTANGLATVDKQRQVEATLLADLRSQASQLTQEAISAAWQFGIMVAVALVAALALMLVIARSLLRPLRILRSNALEVAYVRLPETVRRILADPNPMEASKNAVAPVPVLTREEIGEVARSFDVVHERALRMAAEQALLRENVNNILVNLSRRSQRLVERQLGVIDQMEAEEQDPDQLASLFELDHLATRLRRNGESLLVLSGAGLGKSVLKPVPAADVIGAAVSEIEQYARVEIGSLPDIAVQGLAVRDLVHVLAELLDNATFFSAPDTTVDLRAAITRRRTLAIQITDRGVGMSEEQIAETNERLADPPDLDVSVTRQMGLYVVARLARRHGIEVRLRENEDDLQGGVIARIVVPTELLGGFPLTEPMRQPVGAMAHAGAHSPAPVGAPSGAEAVEWPSDEHLLGATGAGTLPPPRKPMRLDDMVGGTTRAAGPFVSPDSPTDTAPPLSVPQTMPRHVPTAPRTQQAEATDEDQPTKRLPIYQSVMSRWFTDEDGQPDGPETAAAAPQEPVAEPDKREEAPREPGPATSEEGWTSRADNGWQAAQALLESKVAETTPAGLPKRVPNANLVPGSVGASEINAFADTTTGNAGDPATSAAAARRRMVSFQRGYQNGRHALKEDPSKPRVSDAVAGPGTNGRTTENGSKEHE